MPQARQAFSICSSVTPVLLYTRFSRTVPSNSQVSWSTMPNRSCTLSRFMSQVGTPSIFIVPEFSS